MAMLGQWVVNIHSILLPSTFILPNLTIFKLSQKICKEDWRYRKLQVTDPDYNKLSAIDVIIEADVYSFLMRDGFRHRCLRELATHRIILGWILMGIVNLAATSQDEEENFHAKMESDLKEDLQKSWKLKKLPIANVSTGKLLWRIF